MLPSSSYGLASSLPTGLASSPLRSEPSRAPVVDVEVWQREMDAARKEVQKLKAYEKGMLWDMEREGKKEETRVKSEEVRDLRQWRWEQVEAEKAVEEQRATQDHELHMELNRESFEFKRQVRVERLEEERKVHEEEYQKATEQGAWDEQCVRERVERDRRALEERIDEDRDWKRVQQLDRVRTKETEDRKRQEDTSIAMDYERRKLLAQVAALRQSVQLVQSATRRPPVVRAFG